MKYNPGDIYSFSFDYMKEVTQFNVIMPLDQFNGWVIDRLSDGSSQATLHDETIIYWVNLDNVINVYEGTSKILFDVNHGSKPLGTRMRKYLLKGVPMGLKPYYRDKKLTEILK